MRCCVCGCNGPTRYVEFYQNIGALVMRFYKEVRGNLCKRCINEHFCKFTLTTLCVGWFGMISMILTPIFIINNVVRFLGTVGMKTGDEVAVARSDHPTKTLSKDIILKLNSFRDELQQRLEAGEDLDKITMNIGPRAGVSAMQVELYIEKVMAA